MVRLKCLNDEAEIDLGKKWFYSEKIQRNEYDLPLTKEQFWIAIWFYGLKDFYDLIFTDAEEGWLCEELVPILHIMEDQTHIVMTINKMTRRGFAFSTERWSDREKNLLHLCRWIREFEQWIGKEFTMLIISEDTVWYQRTPLIRIQQDSYTLLPYSGTSSLIRKVRNWLVSYILQNDKELHMVPEVLELDVDSTGKLVLLCPEDDRWKEIFWYVKEIKFEN